MKYLLFFLSCAALSAQPVTNLQFIRIGSPDGGGGNTFYEAFVKVNNNFLQLSNQARIAQTNQTDITNMVAAAAVTNVTSYNVTLPAGLNWQAQNDALTYAKQIQRYSAGAVNMFTNGQLAPIASALSIVYNTIGATSLVDVAFYEQGTTVASGTNLPTLRGRIGYGTNITLTPPGIYFNGTNSSVNYWHVPSSYVHAMAIRQASETNASSGAYQWSYSLVATNGGYATASHSSLGWNSSVFYTWGWTAGSTHPQYGIFPRYFYNGTTINGYSEGLLRGQRQFRNAIVTLYTNDTAGITNLSTYIDGVLGQSNNTNISSTACNRIILGHRSDGQFYYRGHISQLWYFNRTLTSNECVTLDRAMTIAAQEIPIVVYGDSISFFDYNSPRQGFEWSQQMWQELGEYTNRVVVHNHGKSGIRADQIGTDMAATLFHRQPYLGNKNGSHLIILAGINNILSTSDGAVTTFGYVSNLWNMGVSNGYTVHACTVLPVSTNYASYNLNQNSNVMYLNNLIRGATNNPYRPFTYLWDFNQIVTDTNALTQLFDGIHPTNSIATAMGKMVGTNRNIWLVTP